MELSGFLLLFLTTWLVWIWSCSTSKRHLPPGPRPLPLLGNILPINPKGFLKSLQELRKKHGDVFTLYLGPKPAIVLCGYKAMREALVEQAEAFSGRGSIALTDPIFQGTGIASANGKSWKILRRFCLGTMKEFGMGKRSIEERIKEEAQYLVEELRKTQVACVNPALFFQSITANIICSIVFGERFHYQDPKFIRLLNLLSEISTIHSSFYSLVFELLSGILKHFPGPHTHLYSNIQELKDFITESVECHLETLDPSSPRDFIDCFLLQMDKERSDPESEFHHRNLIHTVLTLFFAGTETTSSTLCYALWLLLKHRDVLEKVQAEIDSVIGRHCLPALEDRAKMPYTDAVIHEVQRYCDITPIGLPHCVLQDTHFRGYHIPKGTTVYALMSSVLHDPHLFEKPDSFYPGHFLDEKGNFRKREGFISFSMGKRSCLGESLARAELFLFLTTVLQNFSLGYPKEKVPEDIDLTRNVNELAKQPPAYQLCFLPRWAGKEEQQIHQDLSIHGALSPGKSGSVEAS